MATKNTGTNGSSQQKENTVTPLEKFFHDQLRDIYYAEQQMVKAIGEMKAATTTEELEDAFDEHLRQTEKHIKRLEKVFVLLGLTAEGKKCEAMDGLIRETKSIISETENHSLTRDAALIIAAQKVEHYEIATYGGLLQLALTLGRTRVADLLEKTLLEEEQNDRHLTHIAEAYINFEAEEEDNKAKTSKGKSGKGKSSQADEEEEEVELSTSAF